MSEFDPNIKRLAAIAYGEGSTLNDVDEITAIAFAFANRARAWGGKLVDEVIAADPNYTYAIDGTNQRYESFMKTSSLAQVNKDFVWRSRCRQRLRPGGMKVSIHPMALSGGMVLTSRRDIPSTRK